VTRWLVDGMNVIGSRPTGWWRDRPRAMLEGGDDVAVLFASRHGRNAADDDIAALAAEAGEAVRVVTSDSELAERVRRSGAEVVGAKAFRERLDELE
jgi:predicted RNA-binding protein with PIN domain